MTWYLAFRALAVCSFMATLISLSGAIGMLDPRRPGDAITCLALTAVFAIAGCLLIGLGWSEAHP